MQVKPHLDLRGQLQTPEALLSLCEITLKGEGWTEEEIRSLLVVMTRGTIDQMLETIAETFDVTV